MARYTLFTDAISKGFAGTGLRVGWMVAPPWITAKVKALMTHMGAWAPRPEQLGTTALLNDPTAVRDFLTGFRSQVKLRLDRLYDAFAEWSKAGLPITVIPPEGAMYLSVKFNLIGYGQIKTAEDIRVFLLEQADCAVIPFDCFGETHNLGWFRFSVGAVGLDDIEKVLPKIHKALTVLCN